MFSSVVAIFAILCQRKNPSNGSEAPPPNSQGHRAGRSSYLRLSQHQLSRLALSHTAALTLKLIPALAAVLELDAVDLLKTALHESDPDLLQIITEVFKPLCLSATEVKMIRDLREVSGDLQGASLVVNGKGISKLVAA